MRKIESSQCEAGPPPNKGSAVGRMKLASALAVARVVGHLGGRLRRRRCVPSCEEEGMLKERSSPAHQCGADVEADSCTAALECVPLWITSRGDGLFTLVILVTTE
ncbi:hypothetical protein TYRP_008694 [Tyrophagus putrescentiae]|nr:hypothetical protein TYRP_008694 [Tyrophagus putrescentiae]